MNPGRNAAAKDARVARSRPNAPSAGFQINDFPFELEFGKWPMVLKFLDSGNEAQLIEFFESHSPETIHDRYGFSLRMSRERAARLVGVDQQRDAALGLFERSPRASLVAVARYCLADDGRSAELAFVVREDRRRLGIATTLLESLIAIARKRGLLRLTAQVHSDNRGMLTVFQKAGATLARDSGAGETEACIDLVRAPGPGRQGAEVGHRPMVAYRAMR